MQSGYCFHPIAGDSSPEALAEEKRCLNGGDLFAFGQKTASPFFANQKGTPITARLFMVV
jgi:hypothetical protein